MLSDVIVRMKTLNRHAGEWREVVIVEHVNSSSRLSAFVVFIAGAHEHCTTRPGAVKLGSSLAVSRVARRRLVAEFMADLVSGRHGHLARRAALDMVCDESDGRTPEELLFEICPALSDVRVDIISGREFGLSVGGLL